MTPRLKTGIWIKALARRAELAGASAFITRRGDADAGAVLIVINRLDGTSRLLSQAIRGDGDRVWLVVSGPEPAPDGAIAEEVARRAARDPDLWVIEIEDREGRAFVDDPIEAVSPSAASGRNPAPDYPGPRR